jgi:hypothetical protein
MYNNILQKAFQRISHMVQRFNRFFIIRNFRGSSATFWCVVAIILMIMIWIAALNSKQAASDDLYPVFGCGISTAFWW